MMVRSTRVVSTVLGTLVLFASVFFELTSPRISLASHQDKQVRDAKPANSWNNLVPLRSTRADVERLFGKPEDLAGSFLYKFEKENVLFTYAQGNCVSRDLGWNVPAGTIVEILIVPQKQLLLSDTGFDLKKFKREESSQPDLFIYSNIEEGVTIKTRMIVPETVDRIQLQGSVRDLELACPAKP